MKYDIWRIAGDPANNKPQQGISRLVSAVLAVRGMTTADEITTFLSTDASRIHDPFLLQDMEQAVVRIRSALAAGEKIAIYGDYDADGITATALMACYFRDKGVAVQTYIPDRFGEGYGLHPAPIEALAKSGVTLMITVDCGVANVDEIAYAKTLGIDVIVTDHHQCPDVLPAAVAIVNPARQGGGYPGELAGVGVAFQLITALEGVDRRAELLAQYGDLVAIGTVADMMDLSGENRALVAAGVMAMQTAPRVGLSALFAAAGGDINRADTTGIGYTIAPRINAAGRMGDANVAYDLLLTLDEQQAKMLAEELCMKNKERQDIEATIRAEALDMLAKTDDVSGPIILAKHGWHLGVLGIVAARLVEQVGVPVMLLTIENDMARGSCRGVDGFDLFAALTSAEHLLDAFGGHMAAAGVTIAAEKIALLNDAIGAYWKENAAKLPGRVLIADMTVTEPELLIAEMVRSLARLEPCGKGNPNPVLIIEGARLVRVTPIGGGKHVKLQVEKWGTVYDAVFFSTTVDGLGARVDDTIDLAFVPQMNRFAGRETVQLLVQDVARSDLRALKEAQAICKAYPQPGERELAAMAERITPDRRDFAGVWRAMHREGALLSGALRDVIRALTHGQPGTSLARGYVCLRVFDELGLIAQNESAGHMTIAIQEVPDKQDLDTAPLLQYLRTLNGESNDGKTA